MKSKPTKSPSPPRRGVRGEVTLILALIFLTSCATYNRCHTKYANTITTTDSVKVLVPISVMVPRDSVVTSFVTDTTYLYKEIQLGRARVIVERTHSITTVQARCDTVTITKLQVIKVPGERVVWGVKPWFKKAFNAMLYLYLLLIAGFVIFYINTRQDNALHS